jgi:carboxyl-terminal processing protease
MTSPAPPLAETAPHEALPPLFITAVLPGSPAASHGLRPGDIIVSVNGAPPFPGGIISQGVMNLLFGPYPAPGRVTVQLRRPATGRTWTATMAPALYPAPPPPVAAKLLNGDIAYVLLPGFFPGAADQVLGDIASLAPRAQLRGLILDLRGNGGGDPAEVSRLLGAFTHRAAWSYDCDVHGNCTAHYTDSSVPPLHLPLVVLTDRNCASACDAFSGAVKDLRLGTLVGTRTAARSSCPPGTNSAPTTSSSTASASRPTTTSRSPRTTCPPDTTPTSPRPSPCSAAGNRQHRASPVPPRRRLSVR